MPIFLFAHAKRLERLEIASHWSAFLSSDALRFAPHTLPRLRTLRLEDVCITESLEEFLAEHCPSLESLCIYNCAAAGCEGSILGTSIDPTWGEFWKAVRKGCPVLREVICERTQVHPLADEGIADGDDSLVAWPYVDVDIIYGFVGDCLEINELELELGNDSREYRLLMEELARRQQSSRLQYLP